MKNNKRRLLKDLPFENLSKGTVIWKGGRGHSGTYSISRFATYYSQGGSSSNGILTFDESAEEIIDLVWDKEEWFEDANLEHIDFVLSNKSLTLRFDTMDAEEVEELCKGLIHILGHLEDGSYTWNKFSGITTSIKNI